MRYLKYHKETCLWMNAVGQKEVSNLESARLLEPAMAAAARPVQTQVHLSEYGSSTV